MKTTCGKTEMITPSYSTWSQKYVCGQEDWQCEDCKRVDAQRSVDLLTAVKWTVSFLAELNASGWITGTDPASMDMKQRAKALQAQLFTKVRQAGGY